MINGGMISKEIIFALDSETKQIPVEMMLSSSLTFNPVLRNQSQANICSNVINFDETSKPSSLSGNEVIDEIQGDLDDIDEDTQSKISLFQQYFYQKF